MECVAIAKGSAFVCTAVETKFQYELNSATAQVVVVQLSFRYFQRFYFYVCLNLEN